MSSHLFSSVKRRILREESLFLLLTTGLRSDRMTRLVPEAFKPCFNETVADFVIQNLYKEVKK